MDPPDYLRLGLALAIGLLVGLQRERTKEPGQAGIRTFALIVLAGFVAGLLAGQFGGWIVAAAIVFLAAVIGIGNALAARQPGHGTGTTTGITVLLIFGIGAYLADRRSDESFAVVVAGIAALLLHYKAPMHRFVRSLGEEDLRAIMQFVLITLVILPVLPNRPLGPYQVFNPFETWLMVVLIVGISLVGYVLHRFLDARTGTLLGGLLGGLVSSTATTASAAREAATQPDRSLAAALIILIATAVSVVRVLIEVAVVSPSDLAVAAPPIAGFLALFAIITCILYRRGAREAVRLSPPHNPAELKSAVLFGLLYTLVLVAVAAAREHLGPGGLYAVAVLSGLTDLDAITLSTAALMRDDSLEASTGWRLILVAALANVVFKGAIVAVFGHRALLKRIAPPYAIALGAGLAMVLFWPAEPRPALTTPGTASPPPSGSAPAGSPQSTRPDGDRPR